MKKTWVKTRDFTENVGVETTSLLKNEDKTDLFMGVKLR